MCVRIASIAELPTRFGKFQVVAFWNNRDGKEHAAFVHGDVTGAESVPARLHSECLTGDAIGSLRCDCRDQLETALKTIGKMPNGILLYLRNDRIPLIIPPNPYNEFYLRTTARKSGHLMEFGEDTRFMEQHDRPIIEGMTPEQIAALHQIDSLRAPHPQTEG
jgi:GTP cyclohydrolase II